MWPEPALDPDGDRRESVAPQTHGLHSFSGSMLSGCRRSEGYSVFSTLIGSIRMAFLAGINVARAATPARPSAITT